MELFSGLIDALRNFADDYGQLITIVVGVLSLLATLVLGGRFVQRLMQSRVSDLESQLEKASAVIKNHDDQQKTVRGELGQALGERDSLAAQVERVRSAFATADQPMWLREPIQQPAGHHQAMQRSIPIILVANLKGGVGKSTIAANLIAYFEQVHHERVLAIDLDHQGSLSSMVLAEPFNRQERTAEAVGDLLRGRQAPALLACRPVRSSVTDSRIADCDAPFDNLETSLMLDWLLRGETGPDIRFGLAKALHSQDVQSTFQRIIIDAAPRVTTGFVAALCASTHLVVPFVLDALSAERVGLFLHEIGRMKGQLFPYLQLAGIVGTMKRTDTLQIGAAEQLAFAEAQRGAMEVWLAQDSVLTTAPIPRKQSIADAAGNGIAFHQDDDARRIFTRLGDLIAQRTRRRSNARRTTVEAVE